MWMQQSMESASINSQGNLHNRNRFASSESSMYSQNGANHTNHNSDWKSKIMEGGQWLGGKVIAYGGKLARGGSHDTIPDHMSPQLPRNDGRANWMADIRNSSSSYSNNRSYSSNMSGNTYQNDFVTERPQAYSDYASNNFSSAVPSASTPFGNAPRPYKDNDRESSRHVKKKSDNKKQDKKNKHKSQKSKKSKRQEVSSSEEESASESELSPTNDSDVSLSETDSEEHRRRSKSKHKKHAKKRRDSLASESEEDSLEQKKPSKQPTNENRVKASEDYSFSFDPSKLPPPPAEKDKHSKSSKKVSDKSSRSRRQSIESTDSELSDKENLSQSRGKKSSRVKAKNPVKKKDDASVDLLGVDLDAMTMVTSTSASLPSGSEQAVQSNVFDQQLDPMQALAGLNFDASYSALPPSSPAFAVAPPAPMNQPQDQQPQETKTAVAPGTEFIKNLLPKNDIVDLDALASTTTKKNDTVCVAEKLSLNELQRKQPPQQQQPQMPVPAMGNMHNAPMMLQQQQYAMMQQQQSGMPMNPMQMQQMQMQMQMQQHMLRQSMQYQSNQHMYSTLYQQQQFNNGGTPYNPNQYSQHP